jgi:DNA-binding LacI/PurR family transcriptional regulator
MAVRMAHELSSARRLQRRRDALFPALETLATDTRVTAWVGNSDTDALVALDFLRLSDIPVPGRISVAGFDDSYEAFAQKLTSYNFNGSAYVNAMLEYVLRPRRWDSRNAVRPTTLDGRIVQRASVAGAPMPLR